MKKISALIVICILLCLKWLYLFDTPEKNKTQVNFYASKKIAREIFKDHRITLYCGCAYNTAQQINLNSCHMQSAAHIPRAHRMEWEHMMPAENFGRHFPCWRNAICHKNGRYFRGRKCCEKIDPAFQKTEAELYNLWPSVGLINAMRSNFRYAVLPYHTPTYGCAFTVNKRMRKVEPADHAKGIVARANLFMSDHYHIRLSPSQRQLFNAWNRQFPPSQWEKTWANRVFQMEGYQNPYIHQTN